MSRFRTVADQPVTRTVSLGPCECPGSPHKEDTAEVYSVLGWDDLVDVGSAPSSGAAQRILVQRALASWTLEELNGDGSNHPVPITEDTVRLLNAATIELLKNDVAAAYERSKAPLPKESNEELPHSSEETPSTLTATAKPTS